MRQAGADWQMVFFGGAVHAFTNPAAGDHKASGVAYDARRRDVPVGVCRNSSGKSGESRARTETGEGAWGRIEQPMPPHDRPHGCYTRDSPGAVWRAP